MHPNLSLVRRSFRVMFAFAVGAAPSMSGAQSNAANTATASGPAASRDVGNLKTLNLAEYGRWNRINSAALSPDGKWMSYAYQPNDGDATLHIKQLDGDKTYTIPVGSAPQFSDDSKWVGYFVSPPQPAQGGAGRGGRPGGGGGGAPGGGGAQPGRGGAPGAAGGAPTATRRFELLSLATGEKTPMPNAQTFKFSKGSKWLAVRMNKAVATSTNNGADLIVRDLKNGVMRNVGNVNLHEFDDTGKLLAYTVDAAERVGNGVYLLDPVTGETRALNTATADYDQLVWSDEGANLAALRGDKVKDMRQKANVMLVWRGLDAANARNSEWNPASDKGFPAQFVLSEYAAPRWSKDGARIFVGIKEQEPDVAAADSIKANVDVWHWKDTDTQASQMIRLQAERRVTQVGALQLSNMSFTRLADNAMRAVTPTSDGKWGVGRNDAAYRSDPMNTQNRADFYRVNTTDGSRTLIEKNLTRTYGASPDSKWFVYLKNRQIHAYNLESGKTTVIGGTTTPLLIDDEDDRASDRSLFGIAGWAKGGASVLINDKYDIWQVPLEGTSKPVNLTNGNGRAQQVVYRVARLTGGGFGGRGGGGGGGRGGFGGGGGDDDGIDLSKPVTVSAYGDRTKKSGYFEATAGQNPKALIWADKQIGAAQKADSADRVIFTQQTFNEFPDYHVTTTKFDAPRKVTDANPFLGEYAWGKKVLFDYTNAKGKKLQGTITLPANYEPGKRYPMIVYQYEIMSNTHHTFSTPAYDDRPQMSTYASNGYIMMQPDIVFEIGRPGSSALDCVTAATRKVIELGYADPKHIGLQGHSWGGYTSSFIVTQTDLFAAVVTGAPLTNYISMNNILYKQTGNLNSALLETGQGRMGENVTPYNSHDLWESQSPIFHVNKIKTPFLILHGTADGAVDWNQGLEFFNAARRAGKQVILLSYPNEPHHLAIKDNQKDFQTRMKQYFDHHLMGKPAPKWMTDGLPQTKKYSPIQ